MQTKKRILSWRVLIALLAGLALVLAACGGDDDDTEAADEPTTTEEAEEPEETTTTEAEEETTTTEEETTTTEEETTTTEAAAEGGSGIGVTLNDDFEILLDSDAAAGTVTFNVANVGPDFPHALTIIRADSVEGVPLKDTNGAVDTDALDPADIIGSTAIPMPAGSAEDLTVDLEAGNYVFFCPIQDESRSHVAAGQIIAVTVGG